ncbi:MAG: DNA polymerase I [Candidatus Magasanikbacteria bacterium]
MKQKTFVIIDGNAIIHRGYHALPPFTVDGVLVNAVFGFTSILLKVINELKPDYIAVSFDVAGKTFRDDIYEDYKATREKADDDLYAQIPLVYDVVNAFNIPVYTKEGFEADDVIGTISKKLKVESENIKTVIVTGDMDLLQLVDETTFVFAPKKGVSDVAFYGVDEVVEKYGFGPEHVTDYKALRGDASDNIPGVKGVGDKGAKELIEKFGSIENVLRAVKRDKEIGDKIKPALVKKLTEGEKDARMSKELATIVRDVKGLNFDLKKCVTQEYDREEIIGLLRKFEFYSLIKRLPGSESTNIEHRTSNKTKVLSNKIQIVDNSSIGTFLKEIKNEKVFACREILSGNDVLTSELTGFVFVLAGKAYFVKKDSSVLKIFSDKTKTIVGHDIKQLVKALLVQNVGVGCELFDIMIASYLLNSSTRAHGMAAIALRELGKELPAASNQESLFGTDPQVVADELSLMLEVQETYSKKLKEMDDEGLFKKVEMALVPVLADVELQGVAVDTKMLGELSVDAAETIKNLQKKIWREAGEEFNVASSVQLREILFERMGLPSEGIKKGKTGYSTAASELEKLHGIHPIIEHIEQFREVEKLRNTYIDVLPTLINKKTGRIHTDFNQAVTSTGRLSSSNPNLQNIPIRTELGKKVRESFIAEKGYTLIAADYSQIELRIVASLAKDKELIKIFSKGEDVHRATAAVINGVPLDEVTKEMRSRAKAVNFGVLYGMGAFGLASRTGISRWEAQEFIHEYFEVFSGVKTYLDRVLKQAKKDGYVETLFGRRRYIPELKAPNRQVRASGERMAINMPIQGTAADLMKMAMIAVHENMRSSKHLNKDVKMILQVHDEVVLEVKIGLEKEIAALVKKEMEGVVKLDVPVEVDVHVGKRWGKLK